MQHYHSVVLLSEMFLHSSHWLCIVCSQFPEGDGGCSGYVEGVYTVGHGDAHYVVGGCDDFVGKAVALGAHNDGKAFYGLQHGVIQRNGIVGQGHSCGSESFGVELSFDVVNPSPGYEEH